MKKKKQLVFVVFGIFILFLSSCQEKLENVETQVEDAFNDEIDVPVEEKELTNEVNIIHPKHEGFDDPFKMILKTNKIDENKIILNAKPDDPYLPNEIKTEMKYGKLVQMDVDSAIPNKEITWEDTVIEERVRLLLNKFDAPIMTHDVLKIEELDLVTDVPKGSIDTLKDLSYLSNLKKLYLKSFFVDDLTPLKDLMLIELHVYAYAGFGDGSLGYLRDIEPLSKMQSLEVLSITSSSVNDLSPLQNLSNLEQLDIRGSNITDLAPLSHIKSLKKLYSNDYTLDFSPLGSLENLEILPKITNFNSRINDYDSNEFVLNVKLSIPNFQYYNYRNDKEIKAELLGMHDESLSPDIEIEDYEINWNSSVIENIARVMCGKFSGALKRSDLDTITDLDLSSMDITVLDDVLHFQNIETLDLSYNSITDITALSKLKKLKDLNLQNNDIIDIKPLSQLTNLINLDISNNQITDISSLSELPLLMCLSVRNNNIKNIDGLEKLDYLIALNISNNQIDSLESLQNKEYLVSIRAGNNLISGVSVLSNLTGLFEVDINSNKITDISMLDKLSCLETLNISNNEIENIDVVKNFNKLVGLDISDNRITDISAVGKLISLMSFSCDSNEISDISCLGNLNNMRCFSCATNNISDLDSLKNMIKMKDLSFSFNDVSDLSFLVNFKELIVLSFEENKVTDVSALTGHPTLESIYYIDNPIEDAAPLSTIPNVNWR